MANWGNRTQRAKREPLPRPANKSSTSSAVDTVVTSGPALHRIPPKIANF